MNGYINLEIGGRPRGFKFGLWVIGQIIDELGISVDRFDAELQRNPIKTQAMLMYYAARYNALIKGEDIDFSLLETYEWIDDAGGLGASVMQEFLAAFVESMSKDVPVSTGKKKQRAA